MRNWLLWEIELGIANIVYYVKFIMRNFSPNSFSLSVYKD